MGASLDWSALPYVAEYLDVEDVEMLIQHLSIIRDHQERKRG